MTRTIGSSHRPDGAREDAPEEIGGHREQDPPEDLLDRFHPCPGPRKAREAPREGAEEEVGESESQRKHEEEEEAEGRVLARRDEREQPDDESADTGGRDDADEEAHAERSGRPAARSRAIHQGRGHPDLPVAEHRQRHEHQDPGDHGQHDRVLQERTEELAGKRRGDTEGGVRCGHPEHVERRETERPRSRAARFAREEADGQRNHGVDTGREVQRESAEEDRQEDQQEAALLEQSLELASRGPGRRRVLLNPTGFGKRDRTSGERSVGGGRTGRCGRGRGAPLARRAGAERDARRSEALLVVAGLELDRARKRWNRGARPLHRDLDREVVRVDGERRVGERELLHLSFGETGLAELHARLLGERDGGRDQVVLGRLVAVDVPARRERRLQSQRAAPGLAPGRDRGVDLEKARRIGNRRESRPGA